MKGKLRQITLFLFIAFIVGQAWQVIPSFELIVTQKEAAPTLNSIQSLLFLPMTCSAILVANITGILDYHFGTKRGILISLLLLTVGMFFVAIAKGAYLYYFLAQICIGASVAAALSAFSVFSSLLLKQAASFFLLTLYAALMFGSMCIPWLLEFFYVHHTWQEVPLYLGFTSILLYMLVQLFVDDIRNEKHPQTPLGLLFIRKHIPLKVLIFIVIVFANSLSQMLVLHAGKDYLTLVKNVDVKDVIWLMTTFFFAMGIGSLISAVISLFSSTKVLYPALALCTLLGFITLPLSTKLYQMYIATLFLGVGVWSLLPMTLHIANKTFSDVEEVTTSTLISTFFLAIAISHLIHFFPKDSVRTLFHVGLITSITTLLLTTYLTVNTKKSVTR